MALVKRTFDILFSIVGMLLLLPVLVGIAVVIGLDSSGPILYKGLRVGRRGQRFKILKFRTMYETPESHRGPKVTAQDDPRITRVGRFLRTTKLNELPQLVNVLRGEMSFVGPRPEDPSFVEHYTEKQREVVSVRPGITGLASVLYAREEELLRTSETNQTYLGSILPKKLNLDLLYVRNQSFLLDLDVLVRTFMVLVPRFGRAALKKEDVLRGPVRILRRHLGWFAIDSAVAFGSIAASGLVWRASQPLDVGFGSSVLAAVVITSVFSITNLFTGVSHAQWEHASITEAVKITASVLLSTALLLLMNVVVMEPAFPLGMLLLSGFLAASGFLIARLVRRLRKALRSRASQSSRVGEAAPEKVIVVGSGETGQLTIRLLQRSQSGAAFHLAGVVDDDLNKLGKSIHGVPIMGLCDSIAEVVSERDIDLIVFAIQDIDAKRRNEIIADCCETAARTVIAPDLFSFMRNEIADIGEKVFAESLGEDRPELAVRSRDAAEGVATT